MFCFPKAFTILLLYLMGHFTTEKSTCQCYTHVMVTVGIWNMKWWTLVFFYTVQLSTRLYNTDLQMCTTSTTTTSTTRKRSRLYLSRNSHFCTPVQKWQPALLTVICGRLSKSPPLSFVLEHQKSFDPRAPGWTLFLCLYFIKLGTENHGNSPVLVLTAKFLVFWHASC